MNTVTSALLLERDGPVAIIINNDAPMNRMTLAFIDALEKTIPQLAQDKTVRAIIIRGAGEQHFSVGMNLKQLGEGIALKGSIDALLDQRLRVLSMIENLEKPVIAVLCGYCLGGGLELPLACHFRLAAEEGTQIGLPELDIGTVPAWGGTARLTRCVGRAQALDIILRAKKISGPQGIADRIGAGSMAKCAVATESPCACARTGCTCLHTPWPASCAAWWVPSDASLDDALAVERAACTRSLRVNTRQKECWHFWRSGNQISLPALTEWRRWQPRSRHYTVTGFSRVNTSSRALDWALL